jgi:SAM-dependent methyltransferase
MELHGRTLAELRDQTEATLLIAAAHEVGLFRSLGAEPADAGALAERLSLDGRATHITCEALVELGFLTVDDGAYRPTARSREELCDPGGPGYAAGALSHWLRSMRAWTRLDEVLHRGGPLEERPTRRDEPRVARFMSAMAAAPDARTKRIVDLCLQRRPGARTVLDLGGGPGHLSRGFVARGLSATIVDTEDVVQHVTGAYGLGGDDHIAMVAADFNVDPLPRGPFDVVLLSNILHIYSPERNAALVARVAEVTARGGVVAVAEFLRGRSGRAARFAVQMLLHTGEGDAYAEDDVVGWLEAAGFSEARADDLDPERQLVTAIRG